MSTEVRNDLQSSQEAYRKKAAEQREEQDDELDRLKDNHAKEMNKERSSGEASINHIREDTRKQLESLQHQGDQRVSSERAAYDRRLQDAQRQKEYELDADRRELETRQTELHRELKTAQENEHEQVGHEQKVTQDFEKRENTRRAELLRQNSSSMDEAREHTNQVKMKNQAANQKEIEKINQEHQHVLATQQKENKEDYVRTQAQDDAHISQEKMRTSKSIEEQRSEYQKQDGLLRSRYRTAAEEENQRGQQKLNHLQKDNQEHFEQERVRGSESAQKTHDYYDKEVTRLHKDGDHEIGAQKELNDKQLRMQEAQYKAEREERMKKSETDRKKAFEVYRAQMAYDDGFYKKSLAQQKEEFDRLYWQNNMQNRDTLEDSKEKLQSELIKQKQNVIQNLGKYSDKADDPFYRMRTVDYSLSESSDMYELRAKIPEKEKDTVKVIVKEDKIVLQGQRRYNDQVNDANHKVATESYQSFREEIPLNHKVQERNIFSEWKDGVLTMKLPKA